MATLQTVVLTIKGEFRKANLSLSSESSLNIDSIQKYFKKKDQPELICTYAYDKKNIFLFGYKKGKKGTENKTELPEPHTNVVMYGDAIVIVSMTQHWELPIPFTVDQWNAFYQDQGEEEEDEDEDEDEEEDEEELPSEDEKSVKDDFDNSDSDDEILPDKDEEVEEEAPPPIIKRRRAPVTSKVDTNALKEQIPFDSEAESYPLRVKALSSLGFLKDEFPEEEIRELEKGIFQAAYQYAQKQYIAQNWKTPLFCESYRQRLRSVICNLHPSSPVNNTRLLTRIKEGEFPLSTIPYMSSYEMFPEKWFALKDKLLQREQKILEGNKSRATDQFKCRRCQKRECTYYELQTRSADEPMTIFITCLNCGKEWRQGG